MATCALYRATAALSSVLADPVVQAEARQARAGGDENPNCDCGPVVTFFIVAPPAKGRVGARGSEWTTTTTNMAMMITTWRQRGSASGILACAEINQ